LDFHSIDSPGFFGRCRKAPLAASETAAAGGGAGGVAGGVAGGKVLCTTPLTPQGQHVARRTALYQFASPHIDLNPSPSAPNGELPFYRVFVPSFFCFVFFFGSALFFTNSRAKPRV